MENKNTKGLSSQQAAKLLKKFGYNEIPEAKKRNILMVLWNIVKEPMLLLLLGSCVIYAILGDIKDAGMMIMAVLMVIGITLFQEKRTEKALAALKNLASPLVFVIRDGQKIQISSRFLVPGDVVLISEGQRAPADCLLLDGAEITADESLLTGESVPVTKIIFSGQEATKKPGGDNQPFVYSGSLIVKGNGLALVTATGLETEMGKIGRALQTIEEEETLLHKETAKLVKIFAITGLVLCVVVVVLYVLFWGDLLKGLLAGISLSLSMLPEEFPLVLTIFLTLGAWRISKHKVLTRNMSVIETLGATTVLCVDKTGTLTQNKIVLEKIWTNNQEFNTKDISKNNPTYEYGYLATNLNSSDPLDHAILEPVKNINPDLIKQTRQLIKEYPFSSQLPMVAQVWQDKSKQALVALKGAPEMILKLCKLDAKEKELIIDQVKNFSSQGLRVLVVAFGKVDQNNLPEKADKFSLEFSGLLAFGDPIQSTVIPAIKKCYEAGIRVAMITGDYPETAQNIARAVGLENPDDYLTGDDLDKLSPKELIAKIKTINIFARIVPEQKLLIVKAFKASGEIVAMTGDGINDAPALKAANVGLAMGKRGADVAREASDMILLNNDFGSLVKAISQGRQIYDNLQKAMSYIISVHIPIAGMTLLPILFKMPLVLMPAHIAFLELIIDPACSTVFEAEVAEDNIMKRKPRNLLSPILNFQNIFKSMLRGLSVLWLVFGVYYLVNSWKLGEDQVRSITFTTLVLANLALIMTSRSWTKSIFTLIKLPNKSWRLIFLMTLIILALTLTLPILREVFHFGKISLEQILLVFGASIFLLFWFEIGKYWSKIKLNLI